MFDGTALRGFVNTLTVQTEGLNAAAAKNALVATAIAARDRVLSGTPKPTGYRQVVDGIEGAPLTAVRPDGLILFAWQYLTVVVEDTYGALVNRSPRDSGTYIAKILLLLNGTRGTLQEIGPDTNTVHIVASADFARRLEVGKRRDGSAFVLQVAPHIVEETALVARRLYGTVAEIDFTYVDLNNAYQLRTSSSHRRRRGRLITEMQYPAISITPRQS